MTLYRVYVVHQHARQLSQSIDCETDSQAIELVHALLPLADLEIWEGDRKVVAVDRPHIKKA